MYQGYYSSHVRERISANTSMKYTLGALPRSRLIITLKRFANLSSLEQLLAVTLVTVQAESLYYLYPSACLS